MGCIIIQLIIIIKLLSNLKRVKFGKQLKHNKIRQLVDIYRSYLHNTPLDQRTYPIAVAHGVR